MNTQLENLQRQLRISDQIDIIMKQTLELMDMVNRNQLKVNILKEELEQLKVHTDNATDSLKESNDIRGGW
jgi:hypothetical protein